MKSLGVDHRARRPPWWVALLLAPVVFAWVPAPIVRRAGPVIDLSKALANSSIGHGLSAGHGRLLLTSVREEHDPMWLWSTRSVINPGWLPAQGSAAAALNTLAQMQEAKAYAWEVAVDLAGTQVDPSTFEALADSTPVESMPSVDTEGLTGPSGGLMLALAFTDALNQGDLTGGRDIAGTGTIDWTGSVGDIGYVTYKVRGAAAAGATVFFAPWGNLDEARRAAPATMQVVPVSSFTDALTWLCRTGSGDTACAKLDIRQHVAHAG